MRTKIFILLTILSQASYGADLNAAANDVCECLKAPYKLTEKALADLERAQASGDYSKLAQAQGEMMGVVGATNQCFDKLSKKYPEIDKSEEKQQQVMKLADKKCPNPAAAYNR